MFGSSYQKVKDRNDILAIHSALIAGIKRKTIKELYQHGRTDEEFEVLYKKAEARHKMDEPNWAKRDFRDALQRMIRAGLTTKEIEALFKREMSKIDSSGA